MVQDRLLEREGLRVRPEGRPDIPRAAQRRPDLVRFGILAFHRIRDVRVDRLPELSADDVPPDDMGDRSDGSEPLDPEEVREAAGGPYLAGGLLDEDLGLLRGDGEAPHHDAEAVANEIPDLQRMVRFVEVEDLDVFHAERLQRLWRHS